DRLTQLRDLKFSAGSKSALAGATALLGKTRLLGKTGMIGTGLEASFSVAPAQMGKLTSHKPGWVSLWALGNSSDARPLFERHQDVLIEQILPLLNRDTLFKPFYAATQARMKQQSYRVQPLELMF